MLAVTSYGRLFFRAIANSLTQSEFEYVPVSYPLSRRAIQSFSYSSPVANVSNPCKLVSAISGFSKFDSPSRNSSRVPPRAISALDNKLFGDDACFVASYNAADVLGVADGVGGWRRHGIDPSLFSKKLMAACEALVKSGRFVPSKPSELLACGYRELLQDKVHIAGSSTACIVAVDRNKQSLHAVNLGDSGFLVVRRGAIVHRSSEQQHAFNTPYQLSIPPPEQAEMVLHDAVEDAETSSFDLEVGDIILTATDGLFDNLPETVILEELASVKDDEDSLQRTAWSIVEHALEKAFDPDYMSPFAIQARKNGYVSTTGGKPDDVTVLLSLVTRPGD